MKAMDKLTAVLGSWAGWMNGNKYLSVIKDAFTVYLPFTMIGSFGSLFASLLCSTEVGLAKFFVFSWLAGLQPAFSAIEYVTLSCMSIPIAYLIGREMGKKNEVNERISGCIALLSYLCCVPLTTTAAAGEETITIANVLPSSSTGSQGLFVAFIIGILASELFALLMKSRLKIRMPESVPTIIAESFNSLIPSVITLFIVSIVSTVFRNVTGMYILDAIFKLIQAPLQGFAQQGWVAVILVVIIPNVLWLLGIHGAMVMNSLTTPLYTAALAENIAAVNAGNEATNALTAGFLGGFMGMGGNGITVALIVAILLLSRRPDQREIAKVGLLPSAFGISEPVMFGLPIVLNPVYAIPFILAPTVSFFIAYGSIALGFIPCSTVNAPWGLPMIVRAFVSYPTWQTVVVCILILAVSLAIYAPFVLMDNKINGGQDNKKQEN